MKHIRLWTALAVSLLAQGALAQSSSTTSSSTASNSSASNAGANNSTNTSSSSSMQNAVSGSNAANNNSQSNGSASSVNATFNFVNPAAAATPSVSASTQSSATPESVLKQTVTGEQYTYGEQRTYVEYGGTQTIKNVPSIAAPPLASSNDTCMGSASGGLAVAGFGITGGATYVDEHCKRIKMSRELWNKGMKAASLAMDCMDRDAREALELTGFVCPQTARAQKAAADAQQQADARRNVRVVAIAPLPPVTPPMPPAEEQAAVPVVPAAPAADAPAPAPAAEAPAPVAAASPSLLRRFAEDANAAGAASLRQDSNIVIRRVDDGGAAQR